LIKKSAIEWRTSSVVAREMAAHETSVFCLRSSTVLGLQTTHGSSEYPTSRNAWIDRVGNPVLPLRLTHLLGTCT